MADLTEALAKAVQACPFPIRLYFRALHSDLCLGHHCDVPVPSGSTRKVIILLAILAEVHRGKLKLDQKLTITKEGQLNTLLHSGILQYFQPNFTLTLYDLLVAMITISDNTATKAVGDLLGLKLLNAYTQTIGLKSTHHHYLGAPTAKDPPTTTTAQDMGLALELIVRGCSDMKIAERLQVTPQLCQVALTILHHQKYTHRLPFYLPAEVMTANKTGTYLTEEGYVYGDVGVFNYTTTGAFILCVYMIDVPNEYDNRPGKVTAFQHMAHLGQLSYKALQ